MPLHPALEDRDEVLPVHLDGGGRLTQMPLVDDVFRAREAGVHWRIGGTVDRAAGDTVGMDDIFGSFLGLPLHPLVVHGVVVLLPLTALLTVLVAFVRRWQGGVWWVVAANAVVTVTAFVAKESGRRLEAALDVQSDAIDEHTELGEVLPLFAVGVLTSSVVVALLRGRSRLRWVAVALAAVAGAAAVTWTALTGHSGSAAVWDGIMP